MRAVRAVHPEASKKEIIHASFVAMIAIVETDEATARGLQDFAIKIRGSTE